MVFKILAETIPEVNKIYKKYFLYIYVVFKIHIGLEPPLKARPARGYSRHDGTAARACLLGGVSAP